MFREELIAATGPLARCIELAESLWDDEDAIEQFFATPNAHLDNQRPLDVARTEAGATRVENLLRHIASHQKG